MISFLRGILLETEQSDLIVEVNGVGYEVQLSSNSFGRLPHIGAVVSLYIHFVAREDRQLLYGFLAKEERSLFRSLIKINSVGPKMALAILSSMTPDVFMQHVVNNNARALGQIPGVGTKTAQRLIIEMRDSVAEWQKNTDVPTNTAIDDAVSALVALGYKQHEARRALLQHQDKQLPSEELVRLALKEIA